MTPIFWRTVTGLILGQKPCFLGPIQLVRQKVNIHIVDATMVMHGSCVFVQESAKAVEPGWLDGGQAPPATGGGVRTYVRTYVRLSLTSSVWKSTWSTLKVDTYCLQLAIKALAYLESIHCRVYRLLFPQRVCRGAVAYSSVHTCLLCQSLFSPLINFSPISPKLVRTYPHRVENGGITINTSIFLRLISWKSPP